ncbi:flagella assembly protein FlgT middle domain-containing protein [Marinimicrobium alkaliphilum]|uniref:flagella assembly protein FlgT middle domain-containing protein n=1 Tax=Marinimicrobium alkaliphilum TaxID=2202654 RepID=UPI001300325D|nr:flagella assembly protein FlgT middle domain-containing protein [Marinimicrobium alkaliphilum]
MSARQTLPLLLLFGLAGAAPASAGEDFLQPSLPDSGDTRPALLTGTGSPTIIRLPEPTDDGDAASDPDQPIEVSPLYSPLLLPVAAEPTLEQPETPSAEPEAGEPTVTQASAPAPVTPPQCYRPEDNPKHLVFAAFGHSRTQPGRTGQLTGIERELPSRLSRQLAGEHRLATRAHIPHTLAPNGADRAVPADHQARQLARDHRAQLVVSGEILDLSMANPQDTYSPGTGTRWRNRAIDQRGWLRSRESRQRDFVFRLSVREGLTGALVFEQDYQTYGVWNAKDPDAHVFGSRAFAETDYGQAVEQLLARAANDLAQTAYCHPHWVTLDNRSQRQLRLQGGRDQGLKTGDTLPLYQLVRHPRPNRYQVYDIALTPSTLQARVQAVYEDYSVIELPGNPLLNGHFVARIPLPQ